MSRGKPALRIPHDAYVFVGDGRKAVLGIGFEERSEAFDLAVALQEARRILAHHRDQHPSIGSRLSFVAKQARKACWWYVSATLWWAETKICVADALLQS